MEEEKIKQKNIEESNKGYIPIPLSEEEDLSKPVKQQKKGFRKIGGIGRNKEAKEKEEFQTKLLDLARVTRVTGGGKRMSFRAVVVAGNKKGKVGLGVNKGKDVSQAIEKATRQAHKNLIDVVIVNETIPHEVEAKSGAAVILLKPQRRGRGLVAGGVARIICDLAGIKNISAKILSGSKNKLNNARATIKALKKLKVKKI